VVLADAGAARAWVHQYAAKLQRPCVVLLSGELGAGKTQFVRWFLEALGAVDVASPTFAIHHEYETPGGLIDHVDLYRVSNDADLEASGFWDLFSAPAGLVFVEWSDRLPSDVWPVGWQKVRLHLKLREGEAREVRVG
jgi:tRNA threonylcarbamoyladenosine biosynthesis protein TsaE